MSNKTLTICNEQKAKEIAEYLNQPNGSNSLLECHQAAMAMAKWKDQQHTELEELVLSWFNHIEQLSSDRKTANGFVMDYQGCLDEIKVIAKEAQEYLKIQKDE